MKKNLGADLKIVIVGNSGTGKTSFVNKWTKNTFSDAYKATIVSEFGYKIINLDGVIYRIQLWDLAGQDKNTCVTKIFCKDAHGAIVLSDCTDRNSLLETEKWKECIDDCSQFLDGKELPIILIENKIDLLKNQEMKQVSLQEEEFREFSKKNKFTECFRTSAKEGINISESMNFLIKTIIRRLLSLGPDRLNKSNEKNTVKLNKKVSKKKEGCC
jgi:small GTP-binding protein